MISTLIEIFAMSVLALGTGFLAATLSNDENYASAIVIAFIAVMAAWVIPSPIEYAVIGGGAVRP
ncbi:MAG: hypothetical protein HOY44_07310 [Maritimibacter sp.]|uniref:hypothetical protein n=1 Tax=Maritimibacter sp. TaxID=2003363 RepID=UPI001E04F6B2|nr:hypothetical protein [Maritimibacter sp.]MBL6427320.1 hypothetical protein [Maritimibacter sp.]